MKKIEGSGWWSDWGDDTRVLIFSYTGYFFGGLPFVQENLKILMLVIIVVSVLPAVIEMWRNRRGR